MQHQNIHDYTTKAGENVRFPRDRAPKADAKTRRAFDAVAYAAALEILG